MAIARPTHCADDCRKSEKKRLRLNGLLSLAPLPIIFVVICAIGVTGCARNPDRRDLGVRSPTHRVEAATVRVPARAHAHFKERQHAELRVRWPDPALLAPQPAPNCEFKRTDIKAVDPDEWARLQVEYERQCYQDAEKAARDRLSELQTEIDRAQAERR
jgi:hypothetical protein